MRVAIFYLPFGIVQYPHLGTGLLKACLEQNGYSCKIHNYALDFARYIGRDVYSFLEGSASPLLLGERIFAKMLNDNIPDFAVFYRDIVRPGILGIDNALAFNREIYIQQIALMRTVEAKAKDWLQNLSKRDFSKYDLLGFSTSYEQNTASLAMAKLLHQRYPEKPIIFGGSNCMEKMGLGLIRTFEFIDYVCIGEAEHCLVEFVRWLENPEDNLFPIKGIISREMLESGAALGVEPDIILDLNLLPPPDYTDYFRSLWSETGWEKHFYAIAVEGSRGCWKAKTCQCLFCGLNGARNLYRAKNALRFIDELNQLCTAYNAKYVMATDNILSPVLLATAFPKLKQQRPYKVMWQEIKVGLTRSQLELLYSAGVKYLGAGLESLSTHVLHSMRKGVTALENIYLLKMVAELNIDLTWHVICGLPDETQADYDSMANLMAQIHHLSPPKQLVRISIDRHSPLYQEAEARGMQLEPSKAYSYIYDLPATAIAEFAYCFQDRKEFGEQMCRLGPPIYTRTVQLAIKEWRKNWMKSRLDFIEQDGKIIVHDQRDEKDVIDVYSGASKAVIMAAMEPCTKAQLERSYAMNEIATRENIQDALSQLLDKGYLIEEAGQYLFLGVNYHAWQHYNSQIKDNFFIRAMQENRPYVYDR